MHTIGLISDTHGWLDPTLASAFTGVHAIVHAGDIGQVRVLDQLEAWAPVKAVRGNIDGGPLYDLPLALTFEVYGRRIAILHIAGSPHRPNAAARRLIAKERPDVLVVGHSHMPVVGKVGKTLWINPGAAGREGLHKLRTAMRLHIAASGELSMDRIELGPRSRQQMH